MSTLSELIPSGGTQNNIEFVAQGTLANGQTVALRSDGKVEAVSGGLLGSPVTGAEATVASLSVQQRPVIGYHLASKKVVVFWSGTSNYLYASVGTVSGTTLTYSTPQVITSSHRVPANVIYDPDQEVLIILVRNNNTSGYFQAFSVSSDGTLTNGSEVYYTSYDMNIGGFSYDTAANKTVWVFGGTGSGADGYGFAVSMTCSGTTLTVNTSSTHTFASHNTGLSTVSYDPVADKHIIFYADDSNGTYKANSLTVSGNGFTSGTAITTTGFKGESTSYAFTYDSVAKKHILFVYDGDSPKSSSAVAFNISGSTITFGSPLEYRTSDGRYAVGVYDTLADRVIAVSVTSGGAAYWYILTVDNLTLTAATGGTIATSGVSVSAGIEGLFLAYDSTTGTVITSYNGASNGPVSRVLKSFETNASSFIGITNAAISSGATGEVAVKGGLSTGGNLIPFAPSFGTASEFSAANTTKTAVAFDSSNNKIVVVYNNPSDSLYATAVVGTVSGSSITYGTPVRLRTSSIQYPTATFDSTANKVNIVFTNDLNGNRLECMTGTISGTSISVTSAILVNGSNGATYASSVFDVNANRLVICWVNTSNSSYGTAAVGTYNSGTGQQGFGSPVVFNSASTSACAAVYDSNANKVVTGYQDSGNSGHGTAIVGTVSGTSISFGSEAVFESANSFLMAGTFDSNANKVVFTYQSGSKGKAVVCTVSGTSISFGSSVNFDESAAADMSNSFDTSSNKVVVCFRDTANSQSGTVVFGTVSGTSISFAASSAFVGGTVANISTTFDSNVNKTIVAFVDGSDSTKGKALTITEANDLVIGSNYFVQDDGSIATTSSSNKAGKAISTTALNLVDPT